MMRIKSLLDPDGILNPGVLINADPEAHVRNLKSLPTVAAKVDRCIECGFCERVCPSRDLTVTPRQRISLQREIALARSRGHWRLARTLEKDYTFSGLDTCAGDGMCATVCPVGIDTGSFVKDLKASRRESLFGRFASRSAMTMASHMSVIVSVGGNFVGMARRILSLIRINKLHGMDLPAPRSLFVPNKRISRRRVVYFSSCLSRTLGGHETSAPSTQQAVGRTMELCGWEVVMPRSIGCCGQAFESKGFRAAATEAGSRLVESLWEATEGGYLPVVCDTSPCSSRFFSMVDELKAETQVKWRALRFLDFPQFMAREILPLRAMWPKVSERVVLHPTCSTMKTGSSATEDLLAAAKAFAEEVVIPSRVGCCGFAGDKGFFLPALTRAATREEAEDVDEILRDGALTFGFTTCQTCAIGMQNATKLTYSAIAHLCLQALESKHFIENQVKIAVPCSSTETSTLVT